MAKLPAATLNLSGADMQAWQVATVVPARLLGMATAPHQLSATEERKEGSVVMLRTTELDRTFLSPPPLVLRRLASWLHTACVVRCMIRARLLTGQRTLPALTTDLVLPIRHWNFCSTSSSPDYRQLQVIHLGCQAARVWES